MVNLGILAPVVLLPANHSLGQFTIPSTVMQLNALFGEMTHIWDRRLGLLHAWSTLCKQWSQAYSIGAHNRFQRASKARYWDVVKETWNVWQLNRRHKRATSLRNERIQASFL